MRFSKTSNKAIIPDGGLNTESTQIDVPSNMFVAVHNHELADPKGVARIMGYERFDGQTKPSEAKYTYLAGTNQGNVCNKGDTVTGSLSGATGVVLQDIGPDDYAFVYTTAGVFQVGEDITFAGSDILTNLTAVSDNVGASDAVVGFWLNVEASKVARGLIQPVPGSGLLIGAVKFNNKVWAFRDGHVYYSSPSGWQLLDMGSILPFDTGSVEAPTVGATVSNGTATAKLVNIQIISGAWGSNNAAGYLTVKNVSGSFSAADNLTFTGSGTTATATGSDTQITRNPAGYLRTIIYNFKGNTDALAMYGTDSVNQAFKIDHNNNYIPIYTGYETAGAPKHIVAHHHHLFLSYGSSWVHSGIGNPFTPWTLISGADEWGMGDDIVGCAVTPNQTLVSFCQNSIDVIYGSSTADFQSKQYTAEYGAIENSIQVTAAPTYVGEEGISIMTTTQKWGDFELNDVDSFIKTLVDSIKHNITCSVVFRNKQEYRVYAGIDCIRMKLKSGQIRGFTVDRYDTPILNISATVRDGVTEDEVFFTSDDGYVYQMDSGFSFDGKEISAGMMFAPEHLGAPRVKKKWYATVIETKSIGGPSKFFVHKIFDLFNPTRVQQDTEELTTGLETGMWDISKFDIAVFGLAGTDNYYTINRRGTSPAVGLVIYSNNTHEAPYTIRLINHRYAMRGEVRQ